MAHGGAITTRIAAEHGISRGQLHWLAGDAGVLVRIDHGVYILRDSGFPFPDVAGYTYRMAERATALAVASHDTALAVHEISGALPTVIHLTISRESLREQNPIPGVLIHLAPLPIADINLSHGFPATTVARTLVDMVYANTDLAREGAHDAIRLARVSLRRLARQIIQQIPDRTEQERAAHVLGVRGLITEIRRQS